MSVQLIKKRGTVYYPGNNSEMREILKLYEKSNFELTYDKFNVYDGILITC